MVLPTEVLSEIPAQVEVKELLESRYEGGVRPDSWDARVEGFDYILTCDNRRLKLFSDGGQSPPRSGWKLVIREGNAEDGYRWTLYGLPKGAEASRSETLF